MYFCRMKALLLKTLKYIGITIAVVLLLLFILPILFPGKIAQEVKAFANEHLNGELEFKEAKLSFFNHFPSLTVTLTDLSLKGSAPYRKETLLSAEEVAFGIDLSTLLFDSKVNIDQIYVSDALVNVLVNEKGEANYNVYVSEPETEADSSQTALRLEKIAIENSRIRYDDRSAKILIDARGFNYVGKGDLDKSVFDLHTNAHVDSLDFAFDDQTYLRNKKVRAKLVTQINTNSLAFVFAENKLRINRLPVSFTGKFDFLKNGYDMSFNLATDESQLQDLFTALPPQYIQWLETSKVKGETSVTLSLKGQYIAAQKKAPTLSLNMKIREGELKHENAPFPISNLFLDFKTTLPSLNPDQLRVDLDSLYFNIEKDYLKAIVKSSGVDKLNIVADIQSSLDLDKVSRALQIKELKLAGKLDSDIKAKGIYDPDKRTFPITQGKIILKNGLVKTPYYPNAISDIQLSAALTNGNGAFSDSRLTIAQGQFTFEGKPFALKADFTNFDDVAYDVTAKGEIDLEKVYKVFSQKGLDLKGYVKADVAFKGKQSDATSGRYANLDNRGTLELRDIRTTTEYLPKPFVIREGVFTFAQNDMNFNTFKATYGESDFLMNGQMNNVINFVLSDREVLNGRFDLSSNFINVDEFMAETQVEADSTNAEAVSSQGVVIIPKNFDIAISAKAAKVTFQGLELTEVVGNMALANGNLKLSQNAFSLIGSRVNFDAAYSPETNSRAAFDFKIKAADFDIKRAYNEIAMFREMASAAEHAEGIVSLDYTLKGMLGNDMQPAYPSLEGGGTLSVKKVKMKGFKLMNVVSKETSMEGVRDPDVSKVDIKTKIKNNIITIDRFKFKVAGFRPRIEGETSLDGQLNLKMRLGLPPLGIIGIPLTVTGTQDEPKVKLGKKGEDIEEKVYDPNAAPDPAQTTTSETQPPAATEQPTEIAAPGR